MDGHTSVGTRDGRRPGRVCTDVVGVRMDPVRTSPNPTSGHLVWKSPTFRRSETQSVGSVPTPVSTRKRRKGSEVPLPVCVRDLGFTGLSLGGEGSTTLTLFGELDRHDTEVIDSLPLCHVWSIPTVFRPDTVSKLFMTVVVMRVEYFLLLSGPCHRCGH